MIFELIMLLCFGAAWPLSIYKSYKSKTAKGKSLFFIIIIFIGYLSGTIHKIFYNLDFVVYIYILNTILVFIDILITLKNIQNDRKLQH